MYFLYRNPQCLPIRLRKTQLPSDDLGFYTFCSLFLPSLTSSPTACPSLIHSSCMNPPTKYPPHTRNTPAFLAVIVSLFLRLEQSSLRYLCGSLSLSSGLCSSPSSKRLPWISMFNYCMWPGMCTCTHLIPINCSYEFI